MMMGSADALPQAPATKTMFVEDMSESQLASAVSDAVHLDQLIRNDHSCHCQCQFSKLKIVFNCRYSY